MATGGAFTDGMGQDAFHAQVQSGALTVHNPELPVMGPLGLPQDGTTGTLDLLARERGLPRRPDEDDEALRARIVARPDQLTPAAITRAVQAAFVALTASDPFPPASTNVTVEEYWTYGYAPSASAIGVHPPARRHSFVVIVPDSYSGPENLARKRVLATLQTLVNTMKAPGIWGVVLTGN